MYKIRFEQDYSEKLLISINKLLPQLNPSNDKISPRELQTLLNSDSSRLLMAYERPVDNHAVGMLILLILRTAGGIKARIEDVVVDEKHRHQGIARQLMQEAVVMAKSHGCREIDLTSHPQRKAANNLYQSLGFTLRRTNCYRLYL